jgi:flagellar hook-associated protein 2
VRPAGSLTFNVKQLAKADSGWARRPTPALTPSSPAAADGTTHTSLSLTKGGATSTTKVVPTGDGSLAATIKGINEANMGVTATAVQVEPGKYRLQLTSTTTGAGAIRLDDPDGAAISLDAVVAGQNAVIALGTGLEITRPSNTLSDVLEGVTLTLSKADTRTKNADGSLTEPPSYTDPPVTISVSKDTEGIAGRVQALVDAANAARTEAKTLTAFDLTTKAKGRLYGDSTVRSLVDRVRQAVTDETPGLGLAGSRSPETARSPSTRRSSSPRSPPTRQPSRPPSARTAWRAGSSRSPMRCRVRTPPPADRDCSPTPSAAGRARSPGSRRRS